MLAKWFVKHDFLSEENCDQLIDESKNFLEKATVMDSNTDIRNSQVRWYNKDNKITTYVKKEIIKMAKDLYKFPISKIAPLQYTLYDKNMFYDWHGDSTDNPYDLHLDRDISATVLLNNPSEYEGGFFQFNTPRDVCSIQLLKGSIVVFPSLLTHRVTRVSKGTRHSLVAWGTRPFI